eukprot:Nitzschia sp. Nitz4//scaffold90_size81538//8919//9530//NITZ4_005312-RA/size81538-processed-gene-0.45-mRNA-1//-1//CDS//3329559990//4779//frame0
MKSVAFALSLLVSAVTAEVNFMMIPSAATREAVASDICAKESPDTEVPALISLYAMECAVEIVPTEASFMDNMVTTGADTEYAGAITSFFDGERALSEEQEHRHLVIDCINDCWIYPKDAPLICCLLCSWCVGSSGSRRELSLFSTETEVDGEVAVAKNMNDMISCIEGKFQDKCSREGGECIGCDGEGSFTGAVSGFVTLTP